MPKFFYGIIAAVLLLIIIFTFTKPSDNDDLSTESSTGTELSTKENNSPQNYPTIVLDAGHGKTSGRPNTTIPNLLTNISHTFLFIFIEMYGFELLKLIHK